MVHLQRCPKKAAHAQQREVSHDMMSLALCRQNMGNNILSSLLLALLIE